MGFGDEQEENLPEEVYYLSTQVQPICRAWGVRESVLDKIRPFFSDENVGVLRTIIEFVTTEDRHELGNAPYSTRGRTIVDFC